jgi:hypothetical protein
MMTIDECIPYVCVSPRGLMDARVKPGHDEREVSLRTRTLADPL